MFWSSSASKLAINMNHIQKSEKKSKRETDNAPLIENMLCQNQLQATVFVS